MKTSTFVSAGTWWRASSRLKPASGWVVSCRTWMNRRTGEFSRKSSLQDQPWSTSTTWTAWWRSTNSELLCEWKRRSCWWFSADIYCSAWNMITSLRTVHFRHIYTYLAASQWVSSVMSTNCLWASLHFRHQKSKRQYFSFSNSFSCKQYRFVYTLFHNVGESTPIYLYVC